MGELNSEVESFSCLQVIVKKIHKVTCQLASAFTCCSRVTSRDSPQMESCILVSFVAALCVATQRSFYSSRSSYFFAKTCGIITGDAPVSYWPIFSPLSPVIVSEVFAKAHSAQLPSRF